MCGPRVQSPTELGREGKRVGPLLRWNKRKRKQAGKLNWTVGMSEEERRLGYC